MITPENQQLKRKPGRPPCYISHTLATLAPGQTLLLDERPGKVRAITNDPSSALYTLAPGKNFRVIGARPPAKIYCIPDQDHDAIYQEAQEEAEFGTPQRAVLAVRVPKHEPFARKNYGITGASYHYFPTDRGRISAVGFAGILDLYNIPNKIVPITKKHPIFGQINSFLSSKKRANLDHHQ